MSEQKIILKYSNLCFNKKYWCRRDRTIGEKEKLAVYWGSCEQGRYCTIPIMIMNWDPLSGPVPLFRSCSTNCGTVPCQKVELFHVVSVFLDTAVFHCLMAAQHQNEWRMTSQNLNIMLFNCSAFKWISSKIINFLWCLKYDSFKLPLYAKYVQ